MLQSEIKTLPANSKFENKNVYKYGNNETRMNKFQTLKMVLNFKKKQINFYKHHFDFNNKPKIKLTNLSIEKKKKYCHLWTYKKKSQIIFEKKKSVY